MADDLEKSNKSESLSGAVTRPKCQVKKIIPKDAAQSYLAPPPVVKGRKKRFMHFNHDLERRYKEKYSWEDAVKTLLIVQDYFGMNRDQTPSTTQIEKARLVIKNLPTYESVQRQLGPREKWGEAIKIYLAREQGTDCSSINPE